MEWKKLLPIARIFGVLLCVLVVVLIVYAARSINFIGSAPAMNTISVSGHGESFSVPNIATVTFSVEKTAKTVADAQNQVTTLMNDVLASLKSAGIAEKDIQTTSYDINPKYEYQPSACTSLSCPPSRQILVGYTVSNSVQLKIRAIDAAGNIIGLLGQKNVTNLSGLTLSVENDSTMKAEARNKAIAEARQQAESIAKGLGVRLVRITSFNESGSARPMYYAAKDMLSSTGAAPTPSIPIGQNKASSDVTITYEIQ